MNIFNSLGSNYDYKFVIKTLFSRNSSHYFSQLESYLENKYQGKAVIVYKGREAIELGLGLLNLPQKTSVLINGFTCYAVYKAIVNRGFDTQFLDIQDLELNFSPEKLKIKLKENPTIKVVIIQNTLGYPCDIEKIAVICKQNNIILIEDLAHSIGTVYKNNQEAGTVGDLVTLSFSQDKMIDGISGGALIIRNKKYLRTYSLDIKVITAKQQIIDRFYPLFTYMIRATYQLSIGRIMHTVLKKTNLLSNPMNNQDSDNLHKLPAWYCNLIYQQFRELPNNLHHRKQIALIYAKKINQKVLSNQLVKNIAISTNLRFPIFISHRDNLIQYLKNQGIYVSDIWYDAPIAPKKYLHLTSYKDQCPKSEEASAQILNLPTHNNISVQQAEKIAERINQWLTLQ